VTAVPLDAARDVLIALQGQLIALLEAQNAALAARAGELEAANAELAARVDRLERAASRNSGNSSLPPSLDDQPGRTPPARGKQGKGKGRHPGKQPGAPGSHLAWSQSPDRTVPHFPRGACACGADLAGAADLGVAASHQQIEIPEMTATVVQHDLHEVACGCGRVHRAASPAGRRPARHRHLRDRRAGLVRVPDGRARHPGAPVRGADRGADRSPALAGFVHSMPARAAAAVKDANRLIRALIILARVICADETPVRVGPGPRTRKKYLLVACTNVLTYY